jgi:hypothetical protein
MSGSALFTLIIGTLPSGIVPSAHAEGSGSIDSRDVAGRIRSTDKCDEDKYKNPGKVITATLMKLGSMLRVIPPVRRRR